jgi:hypothetical protein
VAAEFTLLGTNPGDPKNPLRVGINVVPADGADLPFVPRAIHVGGTAGNVKMHVSDGTLAGWIALTTFLEVGWHPISPYRIWATGTAATDITAWR